MNLDDRQFELLRMSILDRIDNISTLYRKAYDRGDKEIAFGYAADIRELDELYEEIYAAYRGEAE